MENKSIEERLETLERQSGMLMNEKRITIIEDKINEIITYLFKSDQILSVEEKDEWNTFWKISPTNIWWNNW